METTIFVDQIGYRSDMEKIAAVLSDETVFRVIDMSSRSVVLEGVLSQERRDLSSDYLIRQADFGVITTPGIYQIQVGETLSYPFAISQNPYKEVKNAMIKSYYYQRCGCELTNEYAGEYKHAICHNTLAHYIDDHSKTFEVSGGWHDAGDYGRYIVAAATALGHMLYAYEIFPEKFTERITIPGDDKYPDLLKECLYELEWMLKMQFEDGSVSHKVTTRHFCGMIMPEEDTEELVLLGASTNATATFVASMCLASRIYQPFDNELASTFASAAKKAMDWLTANPKFIEFKNPANVTTGAYGDNFPNDELFWANLEMYRLTKEKRYLDEGKSWFSNVDVTKFGWGDVGGFGSLTYLLETNFGEDKFSHILKNAYLAKALELSTNVRDSGFKTALRYNEYRWGSNMDLANYGIVLLVAHRINNKLGYEEMALHQLHYLLGKNPLGLSFVTGYGTKAMSNPHHRPSVADDVEACVPGLVSGGPERYRIDPHVKQSLPENTPPALCFCDHENSYSTNEVAIYWNSCAIFLAAYFD